ncbi:TonB-dependent receptor domain-containing protein [Nitratireductor indicus]|uniref:TonB-dependent receptor domain-containing protein n=1 Tax=Nitratireductor indicus TaxID=721133 RepID=UPI00287452C7|nr:TonB-dependent receptor [Nitratireductor indicus]MDS1135524.1 TonB-dependent receptor [Nitratireductor indicus]
MMSLIHLRAAGLASAVSVAALLPALAQETTSPQDDQETAISVDQSSTVDASGTYILNTIYVVKDGQENIEATGGTVLTQEDIEELQPADVSELFSRESSVTVSGGGGPSKRIHVLGMEQSNLAVTVDGVPQTATSWHHTGSNVVDPAFLKRVEVEAGAAAADSGFAAAAGAIRYETVGAKDLLKDGKTLGGKASVSYGTNGRGVSSSLAAYGLIDGFDWFVMMHGTKGDDYEDGDGNEVLGTEPAARNILTKLGYEFGDNRIELGYERSRDKADRLIKMNLGLAGDELHPLKIDRESVKLTYTSTNPSDLWDPEVMVYFSQNDYWRDNYQARTNGNMILEEDLMGGKVQNTFVVGPGNVTAGIDFGKHDYHTDNYGNNNRRYRDFSTEQLGAFVQGRFDFDNGFNLSAGARFDGHRFKDWDGNTFSDSGASVNGTLAYRFNDNIEVFVGASRTWLGYVIGDYGYVHARDNSFYTDPGFSTGEAKNFKVGLNVGGDNWKGGITYFDTRISGLPDYDTPSLNNDPDEYRSRGVTLNASYDWGNTRIGATYTKADVTVGGISALPNSGTFMPIGDMATFYIDHTLTDYNLTVGATVEWAGRVTDAVATASGFYDQPSYTVVNAYATWTPPAYENLSLRVGVDNLFNEQYFERSSYAASSNRGGIDPVYAPGRTFTFAASVTF